MPHTSYLFSLQEALQLAVSRGRYGYGNILVFAAGNGRTNGDNCNYDGYANSVYTIAVGECVTVYYCLTNYTLVRQ